MRGRPGLRHGFGNLLERHRIAMAGRCVEESLALLEALEDPRPLLIVRGKGLAGWTDVTGRDRVDVRVAPSLTGTFEVVDQEGRASARAVA